MASLSNNKETFLRSPQQTSSCAPLARNVSSAHVWIISERIGPPWLAWNDLNPLLVLCVVPASLEAHSLSRSRQGLHWEEAWWQAKESSLYPKTVGIQCSFQKGSDLIESVFFKRITLVSEWRTAWGIRSQASSQKDQRGCSLPEERWWIKHLSAPADPFSTLFYLLSATLGDWLTWSTVEAPMSSAFQWCLGNGQNWE